MCHISNNLIEKNEECKYDKLSYERAFKNMKEQNDLLRAQLESQKGKGEETKFAKPSTSEKPNVSNTVKKTKNVNFTVCSKSQ